MWWNYGKKLRNSRLKPRLRGSCRWCKARWTFPGPHPRWSGCCLSQKSNLSPPPASQEASPAGSKQENFRITKCVPHLCGFRTVSVWMRVDTLKKKLKEYIWIWRNGFIGSHWFLQLHGLLLRVETKSSYSTPKFLFKIPNLQAHGTSVSKGGTTHPNKRRHNGSIRQHFWCLQHHGHLQGCNLCPDAEQRIWARRLHFRQDPAEYGGSPKL